MEIGKETYFIRNLVIIESIFNHILCTGTRTNFSYKISFWSHLFVKFLIFSHKITQYVAIIVLLFFCPKVEKQKIRHKIIYEIMMLTLGKTQHIARQDNFLSFIEFINFNLSSYYYSEVCLWHQVRVLLVHTQAWQPHLRRLAQCSANQRPPRQRSILHTNERARSL